MGSLEGKNVLITGAASGIGLATARLFTQKGANVHLIDLTEDTLREVVEELGTTASYSEADVTDLNSVTAAVSEAIDKMRYFDAVVSNAGISGPNAPVVDVPLNEFQQVLDVHVMGAATVLQATLPHMQDGGSAIITSSVTGFVGIPNMAAYATAKHAQIGLMRSVAREVADRKIRVNTIHPGPVDNEFQADVERRSTGLETAKAQAAFDAQIPLGRHVTMEEIAQGMLYLASDASAMVTSTTFRIDGGLAN